MKPYFYASIIFNLAIVTYLKNNKIARKIKREFSRLLSGETKSVPVVTLLNKQPFFCPFSNKLLFYQKEFPLYDRQLTKICHFIKNDKKSELNIIDIGANVGDTVLSIGEKKAFYLCVEGNEAYSRFIKPNLKRYNYSFENTFLSDYSESEYSYEQENATGHLVKSCENSEKIKTICLDNLIKKKYPKVKFDFLKIDTDGFDFKVIRGAKLLLQKDHPVLFFEWDKSYCTEQGEDPLSIFPILNELGYKECILFDNFGNPIKCVDTSNITLLKTYIENTIGDGLPYYYDVLAIPNTKKYTAKEILSIF